MAFDVIVPEVGEVGMEVVFVRWLKAEGDEVAVGETLFEVDTEKSVMEVEAYAAGTLVELAVAEGDIIQTRQVIARILAPGEDARPVEPPPPTTPPPSGSTGADRVLLRGPGDQLGQSRCRAGNQARRGQPAGASRRQAARPRHGRARRQRPGWPHHRG